MLLGEWAESAACRGLTGLMAMPKAGVNRQSEIEAARNVCRSCPVLIDCTTWVLALKPDPTPQMVTAGMTPPERNAARKALYAATNGRSDEQWTPRTGVRASRSGTRVCS